MLIENKINFEKQPIKANLQHDDDLSRRIGRGLFVFMGGVLAIAAVETTVIYTAQNKYDELNARQDLETMGIDAGDKVYSSPVLLGAGPCDFDDLQVFVFDFIGHGGDVWRATVCNGQGTRILTEPNHEQKPDDILRGSHHISVAGTT